MKFGVHRQVFTQADFVYEGRLHGIAASAQQEHEYLGNIPFPFLVKYGAELRRTVTQYVLRVSRRNDLFHGVVGCGTAVHSRVLMLVNLPAFQSCLKTGTP